MFAVQAWFAGVTVYISDANSHMRIFLYAFCSVGQVLMIAAQLPFLTWRMNLMKALMGLATIAHSCLMLGIQTGGLVSGYFVMGCLLFILCCVALFVRHNMPVFVAKIERKYDALIASIERCFRFGKSSS
jgi:hypothetical protein